jgi:hypothetical protein
LSKGHLPAETFPDDKSHGSERGRDRSFHAPTSSNLLFVQLQTVRFQITLFSFAYWSHRLNSELVDHL